MSERQYKKMLMRIAGNIKEYRLKMELTQEDMADYGFDYRFYQRLESGKYSMSLYTLVRLAGIFKVDVADLVKK